MSIIYSLIAKQEDDQTIYLTSYDTAYGNYPPIIQQILKSKKINTTITYNYKQQYQVHILVDGILIFLAFTDMGINQKKVFSFLEDLKKQFKLKYTNQQIKAATALAMSTSFEQTYRSLVNLANSNRQVDKKEIIKKELTYLQQVMSKNIDSILQRERNIELTVKKTAKLDAIATQIKMSASKIKKDSFWKKNKLKILFFIFMTIGGLSLFLIL